MKNFLIADAGATKTDWALFLENNRPIVSYRTEGLNPAHMSQREIIGILIKVKEFYKNFEIHHIFFFGAGCATELFCQLISSALSEVFPDANSKVESDITGAGKALFRQGEGIIAILGTGSATALYKDGFLIESIPSLGFILGDEGSGAALGKRLINAVFKKTLPSVLIKKFEIEYKLSLPDLLERIYKHPAPARFIASFTPFLLNNLDNEDVYDMVKKEFFLFFEKNIFPYHRKSEQKIGMVGSIAFYFSQILREVAADNNYEICGIIKEPLSNLIDYYKEK